MAIKKEVFGKLDAIVKKGAILATNTSYLDVNEIAAATSRPEDVIGMHFFSPANVMRLLEVVRGDKTAKDVIATAMGLAKTIGKVGVLVGVCHGFVGNRMLAQRQREATKLILEGAMPWDVDRVLYDFGLPMGPFAMSDLAGLDIGWSRETSKGETVREILCEMDRRGQKTGAGFYDYDEARNAKPSEITEKVILDLAAKKGINRRPISDEEILQRCIYPMINEGAKILEEGKAIRASDIDTVWVNGYGWPVYRGGPMFYGDTIGLAEVLKVMKGELRGPARRRLQALRTAGKAGGRGQGLPRLEVRGGVPPAAASPARRDLHLSRRGRSAAGRERGFRSRRLPLPASLRSATSPRRGEGQRCLGLPCRVQVVDGRDKPAMTR